MNSFSLLCCLIVGALTLGAPVSSDAQERVPSLDTKGTTKTGKAADTGGRARLKLEPLDLSIEPEVQLKMSVSLGDLPEAPSVQRAQAASLWQALNTSPEDVLRDAQRVQALTTDMGKLRDATIRNKKQLTDLRLQLAQAQESRAQWRNAFLAVLAITLLLVLLAWRRSAVRVREADWWNAKHPTMRSKDM
jgi:hypothetical protein